VRKTSVCENMFYKKTQSLLEYFLLLGVITAVVVIAVNSNNGSFFKKINDKLIIYREKQANSIANGASPQ
jgi:hypothetical protein